MLLRFKIKHGSKEKAMALRKRVLIAVLVVALIAFAIVLTVASVLALLQSSVTVPSSGHIGPYFQCSPRVLCEPEENISGAPHSRSQSF